MLQDQPLSYYKTEREKPDRDNWQKAKADKTALREASARWEQQREEFAQRDKTFGGMTILNNKK